MSNLRVPSVVDALHEEIRHRILVAEEAPGTALSEVSIATRYGVARPTAKAAIERLIADGLVVRSHRGAGAAVRSLSNEDIEDIYGARILVESTVNEMLAQRGAQLTSASRANDRLRGAALDSDAAAIVAADVNFHQALVAELGSLRLSRLHDQLMGEAHFCMAQVQELQLLGAGEIADEHRSILDAIRAGDAGTAAELTSAHLSRARGRLIARVETRRREQSRTTVR